jgi:hypothetical protein
MAIENAQLNIGKSIWENPRTPWEIDGDCPLLCLIPSSSPGKFAQNRYAVWVKIEGPPSQEIWTHTVSSASLTLVSSSDSNISHETQAFCE